MLLVSAGACHAVLGDYDVDDGDAGPAPDCVVDADCDDSANEGCDNGRCAIRCLDDDACPYFSECWAATFCTEPIGSLCDPGDLYACGGYSCRDRDINAKPVDGYCPGYCNPPTTECPMSFTCHMLSCYADS